METVRNGAPGLKGRAIAGSPDYEQIPALVERGRQRIAFWTRRCRDIASGQRAADEGCF